MPTVDRIGRLRVVIHTNDHRPAHVHVVGKGHEAIFKLHCAEGEVELRENYGFSRRELAKITDALASRLKHLCAAWSRIHD
jgi:DNA-binding MarR family transcriptional regulator